MCRGFTSTKLVFRRNIQKFLMSTEKRQTEKIRIFYGTIVRKYTDIFNSILDYQTYGFGADPGSWQSGDVPCRLRES